MNFDREFAVARLRGIALQVERGACDRILADLPPELAAEVRMLLPGVLWQRADEIEDRGRG